MAAEAGVAAAGVAVAIDWRAVRRPIGVGMGYRHEIAAPLFDGLTPHHISHHHSPVVDLLEVTADWFFDDLPGAKQLRRLFPDVPIFLHAIAISPAGALGVNRRALKALRQVAEIIEPMAITEHIAFTSIAGIDIGHLTPPPIGPESAAVVVANIRAMQRELRWPLAFENISWGFSPPGSVWPEARFVRHIVETADVGLLLDLENIHANSRNFGRDPLHALDEWPIERVVCVHITGGFERDGRYIDSHTAAVPETTWRLLDALCQKTLVPAVVIERDGHFPPFAELASEIDRARRIVRSHSATLPQAPSGDPMNVSTGA